jgi:hypothetical protein
VALVTATVASILGKDMALVLQMQQRPVIVVAPQDDAPAATSIASVRASIGLVLHVAQVHRPLAALSRAAIYLYVVYKVGFHTQFIILNSQFIIQTIDGTSLRALPQRCVACNLPQERMAGDAPSQLPVDSSRFCPKPMRQQRQHYFES